MGDFLSVRGPSGRPGRRARLGLETLEDRSVPAGDGLSAIYFDNAAAGGGGQRDFTGANVSAVAPSVNFAWGTGSPVSGIGADTFTARFAGRVEAPVSGRYTFTVTGDDGYRLWVDDRPVVDRWVNQSATATSGTIDLEAGRKYHLVLEYYENAGNSSLKLEWAYPGQAVQVIPTARLYSDDKVFPSGAVVNVKTAYGAVGDGIADDTEALQRAISENLNQSRDLYLPNGTYKVSQTLQWRLRNADGSWVTTGFSAGWGAWLGLQGQNRDNTVIKLADDRFTANPSYPGSPNAVLYTASRDDANEYDDNLGSGNQGFANNIFNLTVNTGTGNPGAVGVDWIASNYGAMDNVAVVSGDGAGYAGVRFVRRDGGPALMADVLVRGFGRGVEVDPAGGITNLTIEHLRLRGQSVVGLQTNDTPIQVRGLDSINTVTAVRNTGGVSQLVLVDSRLTGGSSANPAIYSSGLMLARNVTAAGYGPTVRNDRDGAVTDRTGDVVEFVTYAPFREFADPGFTTLNLAVKETPEYFDRNGANWADVGAASGTDDTAAVQAAMNSGKSTVYFRSGGRYKLRDTITVPASVKHIYGAGATFLTASGHLFGDAANPRPVFKFTGGAAADITLFEVFKNEINGAGTITVLHDSPRTLVLKNAGAGPRDGLYSVGNTANAGEMFLEDMVAGVRQTAGRNVWARQLNSEVAGGVVNRVAGGGSLWVLGVKTEGDVTVVDSLANSRTEVLGGHLYPVGAPSRPAFTSTDAQVAYSFATTAFGSDSNDYAVHVRETRAGVTRELTHGESLWRGFGRNTLLFAGHSTDARPAHRWEFNNTGATSDGGNAATLQNGAGYTTSTKQGTHALTLDGTDDRASVGTIDLGNEFTLAGWVYINAGRTSTQTILSNSASGANTNGVRLYVNSIGVADGVIRLQIGNGTASASARSVAGAVPTGRWVHVAAVVDRAARTARLYADGIDVTASSAIRTDFAINQPVRLGQMTDGVASLGGRLDDVRVYKRRLTEVEVRAAAAAGAITSVAFTDTFNGTATGTAPTGSQWTYGTAGGTVTAEDVPSASNKSLRLADTSTSANASATRAFAAQSGLVAWDFKYRVDQSTNWHEMALQSGTTQAVAIGVFNGEFAYKNAAGSWVGLGVRYVPNTFHAINVVADTNADTFNIWIDGMLVGQNLAFRTAVASVDNWRAATSTSQTGTLYIDDVLLGTAVV